MPTPWMEQIISKLRSRPLQSLAPKRVWDAELEKEIEQAPAELLVSNGSPPEEDVLALKAGLLLWNDSLDASHTFSQAVHSPTGSYWHGIMHRMEQDYSNAKYWFRLTGEHPVFASLQQKAAETIGACDHDEMPNGNTVAGRLKQLAAGERWDPYAFVDLTEQAVASGTEAEREKVQRVQRWEMILLLNYTYDRCGGGTLFDYD